MNTKRQQRLARAIEDLSGRDLLNFVNSIMRSCGADSKYKIQEAVLAFADDTLASEKDEL